VTGLVILLCVCLALVLVWVAVFILARQALEAADPFPAFDTHSQENSDGD